MRRFGVVSLIVLTQSLLSSQAAAQGEPRLLWSSPPDGYIDVRQAHSDLGLQQGIHTVMLAFSEEIPLTATGIEVLGAAGGPQVSTVAGNGRLWTIRLSHPIPAGTTTILNIFGGQFLVTLHSRPGDINLDGLVTESDHALLLGVLDYTAAYDERFDINRDGVFDQGDLMSLLAIQAQYALDPTFESYEPMFSARCCCEGVDCMVVGGDCPSGTTSASECPCNSDSCPDAEIGPEP